MKEDKTSKTEGQTVSIPLETGSLVVLSKDPDIDQDNGVASTIIYEGYVERHVPDTGLIEMDDGTGRAELLDLIEEADMYEVTKE